MRDDGVVEEEQRRPEDTPSDLSAPHSSARLESTLEGCAAKTPGDSAGDVPAPVDSSLLCTLSSESPQEAASTDENGRKLDTSSKSAAQPDACTSSPEATPLDQDMFNSFHFWRTPLPEIDLDKELQQDPEERLSPERTRDAPAVSIPGSPNITMATQKELEEMIENLEPHMDDPDVKAQVEVLSAALRASSLDAHEETTGGVEQRSELRDEVGVSELPDCNISQDTSVPLISAAEENVEATPDYVHGDADVSPGDGFSPDEERRPKVQVSDQTCGCA